MPDVSAQSFTHSLKLDELARSLKSSLDAPSPARTLEDAERQLRLALELALVAGVRVREPADAAELYPLLSELSALIGRYGPEAVARYVAEEQ